MLPTYQLYLTDHFVPLAYIILHEFMHATVMTYSQNKDRRIKIGECMSTSTSGTIMIVDAAGKRSSGMFMSHCRTKFLHGLQDNTLLNRV